MASEYQCPHCGHDYDATGSYHDDVGKHQCDECGGEFIVTIEYEPEYSVEAVDYVSPEEQSKNDAMERGDDRPTSAGWRG